MPNVIPAPIPPATATASGVVSVGATQVLGAGAKEFRANLGGASDVVLKVGTTQAAAALTNPFKAFQIVTGAGGTEVEVLSVRPDPNTGAIYGGVLEIARPGTNRPAINIGDGSGAGYCGGISWGTWNGGMYVGPNNGQFLDFSSTNRGIRIITTGAAYLPTATPSIAILATPGVAGRQGVTIASADAGASALAVTVGTNTAVASVNASAKLFRVATGIGATEVESLAVLKDGIMVGGAGALRLNNTLGAQLDYGSSIAQLTASWANYSAATEARLFGRNGALATDYCSTVGTGLADGSVNAGARLLSARTGIGTGTEVEKFWIEPTGDVRNASGKFRGTNVNGAVYVEATTGGASLVCAGQITSMVATGLNAQIDGNYLLSVASAASRLATNNGTLSTDVGVRVGTIQADGSVHANAKLFSIRTGIAGTEVERYSFTKDTVNWGGGGVWSAQFGSEIFWKTSGTPILALLPSGITRSGYGFDINPAFGATLTLQLRSDGRIDQSGTDSSGTPGNATINKPSGISAIASGTNTVTITNSLATASSRIMIEWYGDHGAARHWVNRSAGAFTVVLPTNATGNTAFGWEVSSLI